MQYLFYNPLSNNLRGEDKVSELLQKAGQMEKFDVTAHDEGATRDFCSRLDPKEDKIYLVGGDGTLQRFANAVYGLELPPVIFCPAGTGNDFCNDVKEKVVDGAVQINDYIKKLPLVTIKDKSFRFVNGIGFGVDGMACEVADNIRAKKPHKKINYTTIVIKLGLFGYKRRNATVTCDGVTKEYKNIWICPTMKGRFYGGGMMIAPMQNRHDPDGKVTLVCGRCRSRIRLLLLMSKVFNGGHVTSPCVDIFQGKEITVTFSEPCAIQVDGETTLDVTTYTVKA